MGAGEFLNIFASLPPAFLKVQHIFIILNNYYRCKIFFSHKELYCIGLIANFYNNQLNVLNMNIYS